jgi:hypothetical protein
MRPALRVPLGFADGGKRLGPPAIEVPGMEGMVWRDREVVFTLLDGFSPPVGPWNAGEALPDLTGTGRRVGAATNVAARLEKRWHEENRWPAPGSPHRSQAHWLA